MYKNIVNHSLRYIAKEAIKQSEFLGNVSDNRLRNIVLANVDLLCQNQEIKFRKSTDLGMAVNQFSRLVSEDNLTETSFKEAINEEGFNQLGSTVNKIVDSIKKNLYEAREELVFYKSAVTTIMEKYDIMFEKYHNPSPTKSYLNQTLGYEEWTNISILGEEASIIEEVNKVSGIEDDNKVALNLLSSFINKLNNNHILASKKNTQTTLDEKKKQDLSEAFSAASGISLKECRSLLDTVVSKNGINYYISFLQSVTNGLRVGYFDEVTSMINRIYKFTKAYNKVIVNGKEKELFLDSETVKYNVGQLQEVLKGLIYVKSFYRYNLWKNMLILPNGKVNKDLMDEAESAGISKNILRLYVHRTDFSKGRTSFSINEINNTLSYYKKQQEGDDVKAAQQAKLNLSSAQKAAFSFAMREYLRVNKINVSNDFIDSVASSTINLKNPPEYGFYKILMKVKAPKKITSTLYDEFGKAFSDLVNETENIDNRMLEETQAAVLTKYINNFMVENYC